MVFPRVGQNITQDNGFTNQVLLGIVHPMFPWFEAETQFFWSL
jgi:hypothetical protein